MIDLYNINHVIIFDINDDTLIIYLNNLLLQLL